MSWSAQKANRRHTRQSGRLPHRCLLRRHSDSPNLAASVLIKVRVNLAFRHLRDFLTFHFVNSERMCKLTKQYQTQITKHAKNASV